MDNANNSKKNTPQILRRARFDSNKANKVESYETDKRKKRWATSLKQSDYLSISGPCEIMVRRVGNYDAEVVFILDQDIFVAKNIDPESRGNR